MINAPDSVISAEGKRNFPLPEPKHPTRFTNGSGMVYEIEVVRQCLLRGHFFYLSEYFFLSKKFIEILQNFLAEKPKNDVFAY